MSKLSSRLTYANVVATLALVIAVAGGTAYAANTVFSADIVNGEVKTADLANRGVTSAKIADASVALGDLAPDSIDAEKVANNSLGSAELRDNAAVQGADVRNGTLDELDIADGGIGGQDIRDGSITRDDITAVGLEHCPGNLLTRLGEICALNDGVERWWFQAITACANFGLRLPTLGEAMKLATIFDVPGVSAGQSFWTQDVYNGSASGMAWTVSESSQYSEASIWDNTNKRDTVCVTAPGA